MKDGIIEGMATVEMSFKDIALHNELVLRNKPMMAKKEVKEWGDMYYCPVCGKSVGEKDLFCSNCGQRIDPNNVAF